MMQPNDRLDITAVLVSLLTSARQIEGRVRLQKTLYLLKRLGLPALQPVYFTYHHYGPYSEDITDILMSSVSVDIVQEIIESYDDEWQLYRYLPGREAARYSNLLSDSDRALVEGAWSKLQGHHWRTLELAATVDYLARAEAISREQALARALELKPACKPYEHEAMALLDRLALPD